MTVIVPRLVAVAVIGIVLVFAGDASAQLATAELNGRVTDSSGAVLPGASVTATQTGTGLVRSTVTDAGGNYLLSNLPTGPYRLEVALQGFKSYVQTGLVLQVGATPTVNAALELGSLEESVTVEAAAPIVDVRSAGISNVVEQERIVELPLQGRQVTDLLVLSGAAVQTGVVNPRGFPSGVNISVAGGLQTGVSYILDGATHNNFQQNVNLPLPFPDALQEFRVATSGLSAQNGTHSAASVNAITKSGTNQLHGNGFEFLRHHSLNATSPFAAIGPDGKRKDDGLKRNQFGGTIGGPVLKDRLFFFGGYQATMVRRLPTDNIAFLPTAAMLGGDFTAVTAPACNGGRQINLRAPYVNNRIDPAQFSPAAMNLARRLPSTTDPCGKLTYGIPTEHNEQQGLARIDYQLRTDHSVFGRYLVTDVAEPAGYKGEGDSLLNTNVGGVADIVHSVTFGQTSVFSPSVVNAVRVAVNRSTVDNYQTPFFSPKDIGANIHAYYPGYMILQVTGGFTMYQAIVSAALFHNNTYQFADDLTIVKGNHQIGIGVNIQSWNADFLSTSKSDGDWRFDGSATGLGLADFLLGRVSMLEHGNVNQFQANSVYPSLYAQDSWRLSSRVTINGGLRWEPFFGQNVEPNVLSVFNLDNFRNGVKSKVYLNAPAGLSYNGDDGFPENGQTGLSKQWWNLSPRFGVAWDVLGDGRLAVRSSYSMSYDFMSGEFHNINAQAPPFGNRSLLGDPTGLMDNPYKDVGGDPHPIVTNANTVYPPYGAFGTMDPDINSPRIQQWNAMVEQQLGTAWGVSAAYLGSHTDRVWNTQALNPGVFMGLGPCVINGVSYPVCSTNSNLNQRRALSLLNPREGGLIGVMDEVTDIGYQNYHGLKLTAQRRSATGLSLNGNYTLSVCKGIATPTTFLQASSGYIDPTNPSYDYGYCDQDRRHLSTVTAGYETPDFGASTLSALASHWRISAILSARSGPRVNILSGRDNSLNGQKNQRPNQVSDDIYAEHKTLNQYFNPAAFTQPAPGTLGNTMRNAAVGPNFWNVDLAVSRLIALGTRRVELRFESFNVLNHFNWGSPADSGVSGNNFGSGSFGRIATTANDMRIIQLGVKFDF